MHRNIKKTLVIAAGVFFVILGILGLALPFLQGLLFIVIGVVLLSLASTSVRDWLETHTRRYPKLHKMVEKMQAAAVRIIGSTDG